MKNEAKHKYIHCIGILFFTCFFILYFLSTTLFAFTPAPRSKLALKQHPRLIVTDWNILSDKINNDAEYKVMYDQLKIHADQIVQKKSAQQSPSFNPGSLLASILTPLFVGQIEKARNNPYQSYVDFDISVLNFLIAQANTEKYYIARGAHENFYIAVALAYDWYYHDLSISMRQKSGEFLKGISDTLLTANTRNPLITANQYGTYPFWGPASGLTPLLAIVGDGINIDTRILDPLLDTPDYISNDADLLLDRGEMLLKQHLAAIDEINFPSGGLLEGWEYNLRSNDDYGSYKVMMLHISAYESATSEDLSQKYTKSFKEFPVFAVFSLLDNKTGERYGSGDGGQGDLAFSAFSIYNKPFPWLWAWFANYNVNSTVSQLSNGYAQFLKNRTLLVTTPIKDNAVWFLMFDNKSIVEKVPSSADNISINFEGVGMLGMRNNFQKDNDLKAYFRYQDFYMTSHQHTDVGSFVINKEGAMAIDSGTYYASYQVHHFQYSRRTIAHNGMLIFDPNDPFLNSNIGSTAIYEGGQIPYSSYFKTPVVGQPMPDNNDVARGRNDNIPDVEITQDYDYTFLDQTRSYPSRVNGVDHVGKDSNGVRQDPKVSNVIREFVRFKNSDYFVVLDRVSSIKKDYKKSFLLHSDFEPQVNGRLTGGVPQNAYGGTPGVIYTDSNFYTIDAVKSLPGAKIIAGNQTVTAANAKFKTWGVAIGDKIRLFARNIRDEPNTPSIHKDFTVANVISESAIKVVEPITLSGLSRLSDSGIEVRTGEKLFVQRLLPEKAEVKLIGGPNKVGDYNRGMWGNFPVKRNDNNNANTIATRKCALSDMAELFTDLNNNGVWDSGESFTDTNNSGTWDDACDGPNSGEFTSYDFYVNGKNFSRAAWNTYDPGGAWRLEVSPTTPDDDVDGASSDIFLHVMFAADKGETMPITSSVVASSGNMTGALILESLENRVVMFSNDPTSGSRVNGTVMYIVEPTTKSKHYLFDMQPSTSYIITVVTNGQTEKIITVSPGVDGVISSAEGVLVFPVSASGQQPNKPFAPRGFTIRRR